MNNQVTDFNGKLIGTYVRSVNSEMDELLLVERQERLGGGTIVVPMPKAGPPDEPWQLPYCERSVREAPPYSPNVNLQAYVEFWKRLGPDNFNRSQADTVNAGSGPVDCQVEVPDDELQEQVRAALNHVSGVFPHLITTTVTRGTVLLEGYQGDTIGRLRAAQTAASIVGVKEVINMLVIRSVI